MAIRTVQWNIGGGKIRKPASDPALVESYREEGISYIVDKLQEYRPDIITLQETHESTGEIQAHVISQKLGLPYFVNDTYDRSHLDATQRLGQAIISRFPLENRSFTLFFNPHYRKVMKNGEEWTSHDKGISTCAVKIGGQDLLIQTLHLIPFRKFDVDLETEDAKRVRGSISTAIEREKSPYLLQGDFNYKEIRRLLPDIFQSGIEEAGRAEATTPKGGTYDHTLFRGMKLQSCAVDSSTLTDHFPIISSFEL